MRRLIAGINMTVDGFCEHTAMTGDEELHQHYTDLLNSGDTLLYGRITYQLMENYWPAIVKDPTGNPSTDEFALAIDRISKIVFSRTLQHVDWKTARLAKKDLKEEVAELRQQAGGDILVGSRSLIVALLNFGLVDELQLTIHPVILGKGVSPLLNKISDQIDLKLLKTKNFSSGAITLYYEPGKK